MRRRFRLTERVTLEFNEHTNLPDVDYTVTIITDDESVTLTDRDWCELDVRIKRVRGLAEPYYGD